MKSGLPAWPETDRDRARLTRFTFLTHLRPVSLHPNALRWQATFGLGGSSLVLLLLLVFSGTLQMAVYQPVPGEAHESVRALETEVMFGSLVRGIHYWSANLLVIVALLHAARTFLTGGYVGKRGVTWVLGVVLMLLIVAACFTGYLLPWDQLAYWAITIVTGMFDYLPGVGPALKRAALGGAEISDATLGNFFTLHTAAVPVALAMLAAWHFWRVRRAGGVVRQAGDEDAKVMFWPDLLVREVAQGLAVVAVVVVLAATLGAPLGEAANPGMSPNPAQAPWYFAGLQELLIHFHPVLAVLVLPLAGLILWLALPWLVRGPVPEGVWFLSPAGRWGAAVGAITGALLAVILVLASERVTTGGMVWLIRGLVPMAVLAVALIGVWFATLRRPEATRADALQAVVVLIVVAFVILTLVGAVFRGEGMALDWPGGGS